MKKEILTKEKMKSDILPLLLGDIAGSVVAYIFLLLLGTLVILFIHIFIISHGRSLASFSVRCCFSYNIVIFMIEF